MINLGRTLVIKDGDRVAQLVIHRSAAPSWRRYLICRKAAGARGALAIPAGEGGAACA
jgi:dUTPase